MVDLLRARPSGDGLQSSLQGWRLNTLMTPVVRVRASRALQAFAVAAAIAMLTT